MLLRPLCVCTFVTLALGLLGRIRVLGVFPPRGLCQVEGPPLARDPSDELLSPNKVVLLATRCFQGRRYKNRAVISTVPHCRTPAKHSQNTRIEETSENTLLPIMSS
ncbi:unnamed protein product [Ixodes persulcatus]